MSDAEIKKEITEDKVEAEEKKADFTNLYDDDEDYDYEAELDKIRGNMSLINHLDALRKRIIIILITLIVTSCGAYYYSEKIVNFLTSSAGKLYYITPAEAFFAHMKVSFVVGFMISLPIIIHQIWLFIAPGLRKSERKAGIYLIPASIFLFFIGISFSYFAVLPAAMSFFIGFQTDSLQPMLSLGQYLSFVLSFILPFGFVFQLPIVIIILTKFGIVNPVSLQKQRKYVLLIAFVIGAIVSPTPDILSQFMIAVPTMLLFEISLFLAKYMVKSKEKSEETEET